jgi:hypothetical protein
MKYHYQQGYSKFYFTKIVKKTDKATLFEIAPKVQIWLPNSWLSKLTSKSFTVKDHIATDVKLKIVAEQKSN